MSGTEFTKCMRTLESELEQDPENKGYISMPDDAAVSASLQTKDSPQNRGLVAGWELANCVDAGEIATLRAHDDRWYFDALVSSGALDSDAPNIQANLNAIFSAMPNSKANLDAITPVPVTRESQIGLPDGFANEANVATARGNIMARQTKTRGRAP